MDKEFDWMKKQDQKSVLVLGSKGVGKSSLIFQHLKNGFEIKSGPKDELKSKELLKDVEEKIEKQFEEIKNQEDLTTPIPLEEENTIFSFDSELKLFNDLEKFEKEVKRLKELKQITVQEKKQLKQYKMIYQQIQEILTIRLPTEEELEEDEESDSSDSSKRDSIEQSKRDSRDSASSRDSIDKVREDLEVNPLSLFKEGIEKFSVSYKEGIKFLNEKKVLGTDSRNIARFLIKMGDLDKIQFGLCMGNQKQMEIGNAVAEFMIYHPLFQLDFEESLRNFLKLFILPSEGQQVARISDLFSDNYIKIKPNGLDDPENAVLLTAGILMLNVSLHNPKIKNKDRLKKEQFLKLLESAKFTKEFLSQLYDNIKNNEIKYNTVQYEKKNNNNNLLKNILKKKESHTCKSCIFLKEMIQYSDGSLHHLEIKDLCSKHIQSFDISNVDSIIIVFSVMDPSSLDHAINYCQLIKKKNLNIKLLLCANKVDEKRSISLHKGLHAAMDLNIHYIETSTYINYNVDLLFQSILDPKYSLLEFKIESDQEIPKIFY